ncbi:MAG: DUF4386 domain-containing protein [Cytophagaceae bacterium]|nr:DUF4386 domain-containing protein [Cytophagaceae bacterium]
MGLCASGFTAVGRLHFDRAKIRKSRLLPTLGVISVLAQLVGLLRWTFVVPVLANTYVTTSDEATRATCKVAFQAVHQYGGVLLGKHVGQLFTIAWTVLIASAFAKLRLLPKWVLGFGYASAGIYLLAQAELAATVIPDFPVWAPAGLLGSSLWLVWLIVVGVKFLKIDFNKTSSHQSSIAA